MANFSVVIVKCCMLLTCSICDISDTVYHALNGDVIQCSSSSVDHQTVRSAGLFASLRCLIPKQRHRFNKLLELILISECFVVALTIIYVFF